MGYKAGGTVNISDAFEAYGRLPMFTCDAPLDLLA